MPEFSVTVSREELARIDLKRNFIPRSAWARWAILKALGDDPAKIQPLPHRPGIQLRPQSTGSSWDEIKADTGYNDPDGEDEWLDTP